MVLVHNLHGQLTWMAKQTGQPPPAPLEEVKEALSQRSTQCMGGPAGGHGNGGVCSGWVNKKGRGLGGPGTCRVCEWNDHPNAKCYECPENAALHPTNLVNFL